MMRRVCCEVDTIVRYPGLSSFRQVRWEVQELKNAALFKQQCYIDGAWCDADEGQTIPVTNPASGAQLGTIPRMGAAETRRAIQAANRAWGAWRSKTAKERADILRRWYDLMHQHTDDLARIMTLEQGKPLTEARGEISYAASYLEWYAEEGKSAYGDTIPTNGADRRIVVIKEPVGVCAAITPWNFTAAMITRKAAAALAAGCTMVVKPSGLTPLSALALDYLAEQAGIPAGVFNVLTGDSAEIGKIFCQSRQVKKLSFTGSTEVGRRLMAQSADNLQKLSLELGGTAPPTAVNDAAL